MDKQNVEQTLQVEEENIGCETAETEVDENTSQATVSYGKFKDASALLNAYNALEAEFTKRCQKIKELEAKLTAVDKEISPTGTVKSEGKTELSREEILKSYVTEILKNKQSAIVLDGTGIGAVTPIKRPKTFDQAGKLAVEIFKN